jgi:hypothetical protein
VPADLTVEKLAGQPTGKIASHLQAAVPAITTPEVRAFIAEAASALAAVRAERNHLLHARPATIDGKQRLYRWKLGGAPATFVIADEWIDQRLAEIDECIRKVSALRGPVKSAVTSP